MSSRDPRERLFERRLHALAEALPAARSGDPEAVHQARVASRRVREAIPVVLAEAPRRTVRRLRRRLRRVTRALGPVRELDVSAARLLALEEALPEHRAALEVVHHHLQAERRVRSEEMLGRLEGVDADDLAARFAVACAASEPQGARQAASASRAVLAVRVVRRARAFGAAIDEAGAVYAPDRLHAVRIAAKKLRYALELAREDRLLASVRAVNALKRLQDALGDLHDLQVLASRIAAAQADLPHASRALDRELAAVTTWIDGRCRALHAQYVAGRERVRALVDHAVDTVAGSPAHRAGPAPASFSVH